MIMCVTSKIIIPKIIMGKFLEEIPKIEGIVDYFYLFYADHVKLCLVGLEQDKVENKFKIWKSQSIISDYMIIDQENVLDISKIIACASRKISDYLKERINPMNVEKLVDELVNLPEINADSYAPLHFILNQLELLDRETEIRFKIKTNPKYIEGYKMVGNILVR
ncbi:MAG: hypothetical protein Q8O84_05530 [Nanoarchaeota archaeon]|nr:hypothetical protein [Nanoarchaeota archaeon]